MDMAAELEIIKSRYMDKIEYYQKALKAAQKKNGINK